MTYDMDPTQDVADRQQTGEVAYVPVVRRHHYNRNPPAVRPASVSYAPVVEGGDARERQYGNSQIETRSRSSSFSSEKISS